MAGRTHPGPRGLATALLLLAGCGGGGDGVGGVHLHEDPPRPPARSRPVAVPTPLRLHIAALHVTQGTQTLDGAVPLVQDRPGCLRVFVLARSWHGPGPAVRVHVRDAHGHPILTRDILPPGRGVPSTLREAAPGESWDLPLPARCLRPGITVQAELLVPEGDPVLEPGRRIFPQDGRPLALEVRPVPPLRLTLVPIRSHGRVGRIAQGGRTLDSWVAELRALYPLAAIDVQEGPEFQTDWDVSGHANVWPQLLADLEAWRLADGRNDSRYFYGVVPLAGATSNGSLGRGYIGVAGSRACRTAIGIDGIDRIHPQYSYDSNLAHELGHNFGRTHTPCGTSPSDPDYPYPDGHLDVCGFDLRSNRPLDPATTTDIMGYCGNKWVSRYTYEGVLAFRSGDRLAAGNRHRLAVPPAQDSLLVWGSREGGRMALTAALRVHRRPLPPAPGDYHLELVDGAGQVLQSTPFAPVAVADDPEAGGFTLVVPLPPGGDTNLGELRITHQGQVRAVLRPSGHAARSQPGPKARRGADGRVHFTWDATAFPRVLVQDGPGGASLALGAGGSLDLRPRGQVLDCTFSDGLHSVRHPVPVE